MSVAPAHRTRDSDSTFVPDLGAELEQVVFLPHWPRLMRHTPSPSPMIGVPPAAGAVRRSAARRSCRWIHNFVVGHQGYDVTSGARGLRVVRAVIRAAHHLPSPVLGAPLDAGGGARAAADTQCSLQVGGAHNHRCQDAGS